MHKNIEIVESDYQIDNDDVVLIDTDDEHPETSPESVSDTSESGDSSTNNLFLPSIVNTEKPKDKYLEDFSNGQVNNEEYIIYKKQPSYQKLYQNYLSNYQIY